MHELAVCQALLGQVEAIAGQYAARSISSITLRLGPLSGVDAELLRAASSVTFCGTVADGADLIIEEMPVRVRCNTCNAESVALPNQLLCAVCGDWHTSLAGGDELLLASVELIT